MAIMDAKTVFANQKALSITSGGSLVLGSTVWSGAIASGGAQIVDQEKAGDAVGQELTFKAHVGNTAIVGGSTAAALQLTIQTSEAVDSGWRDLVSGPALTVGTSFPKGERLFQVRLPPGSDRYLRLVAKAPTAAISSGTIVAYLTRDL